ncbi:MAG: protein kinase [Polyangiales bacterium]
MPILTTAERIGTVLAQKYRLSRVLGEGGMGVVFEGQHEFTRRRVAVKLLHPHLSQNEAMVQRFLREARAAAALKHKNVVDVLDMGTEADGSVYLVLEFLVGEPLSELLHRERKLPPEECAKLLFPIMNALRVAHARGIVHRDIKPENVFLVSDDESGAIVPKLLDFGIAKLDDGGMRATSTGQAIGTPAYMAPEQATSAADVDARADVWSLGVMWFEALSGKLPYSAETPMQMIGLLLSRDPLELSAVATDVPLQLARAVERALRRDRAQRWSSIDEFADALRACFPEGTLGPSVDSTGALRALTRSETVITPSPANEASSPSSDRDRDERAMMATVDAGAAPTSADSPDDPRAQQTLPARPSSRNTPPEPQPSAERRHETLAGIEHPKPRPRPAWLVGASALTLATVVALVAVGASRRATSAAQPQATAPAAQRSANTVATPAPNDPPSRAQQEPARASATPPAVTDAGANGPLRAPSTNTASTAVRATRTTNATSAPSTVQRANTRTTTASTSSGPASDATHSNSQTGRVRVMGW